MGLGILVITTVTNAQTPAAESKKREIGLRFTSINFNGTNNFNVVYKKQKRTNENKYMRYRAMFIDISFKDHENPQAISSIQGIFGLAIGVEKRKVINEKFKFVHGWEFACFMNNSHQFSPNNPDNYSLLINPSIGYVIGCQYDIKNNFCLNLELIPSLYNTTTISDKHDVFLTSSSFNFNFTSNAALSIMYKF